MQNWLRAYELIVEGQSEGFKVGTNEKESSALKVSFSVEKTSGENANDTSISIYNLSEAHRKLLDTNTCKVKLRAGYGTDGSACNQIFVGDVTSVTHQMQGGNIDTQIKAYDGHKVLKDTDFNLSYSSAMNTKKVYEQVAANMNCAIEFAEGLEFKTFPSNFSFVGKPKAAFDKIVGYNGHAWSIQNGIVQITKPGQPMNLRGFLLSKDTGLISIPKQIKEGEGAEQKSGWEVDILLNSSIEVSSIVKIESKYLDGEFVVAKVKHDGDNYSGQWTSKLTVYRR